MAAISKDDLLNLGVLSLLLPVSWLLPRKAWRVPARGLGSLHAGLLGADLDPIADVVRQQTGIEAKQLEVDFRSNLYLELMEILREHSPVGWNVDIELVGRQHIDDALKAGKGALLWFCPFTHGDIVFKRGLAEAGYEVHHLSALTHGFSGTRFGMSVLNPIKVRVEKRYLKERLVLDEAGGGPALRALLKCLRANQIGSITAVHTGRRVSGRKLFGGEVRLAHGAPSLAAATGAALLPVFTVPADGGYKVCVEPALPAEESREKREEAYISAYVPVLERYIRQHPELWRGWFAYETHWLPPGRNAA